MLSVKCQNGICKNLVIIIPNRPYNGTLCESCMKTKSISNTKVKK